MSQVRLAIAPVAAAALSLWSVTVLGAPVPPALVPMVVALQGQTQVPLLLPATIPFDRFRALPESVEEATAAGARLGPDGSFAEYFPVVVEATPERYTVVLSVIPESAGPANFGSLAGEKLEPGAREPERYTELVRDFQREYPSVRSPERPAPVALQRQLRPQRGRTSGRPRSRPPQ